MTLLTLDAVCVRRDGRVILDMPRLAMEHRDQLLLLGPSGSGKTSLLSVMAGLLKPDSGQVLVDGVDLYALAPRQRDILRGRHFGFVFQTLHLIPYLTVYQNVAMASIMAGVPVDRDRIHHLLSGLGVGDKARRKPFALSHGEAQRVAIARAVVNRPHMILADEPTSALDDESAQRVAEMLLAQARDHDAALMIATHDGRLRPAFAKILDLGAGVAA